MFHRQVLLNFVQQDLESLYSAWWRYKNLLINFPHDGFSMKCQLEIFLNSLCNNTRIQKGKCIISFYQRSVDEAYYLLEDIAKYDHWKWTCSKNKQAWRSNSNIIEPRVDTQLQDQLVALNGLFVQGIEIMRQIQEESFANAQCMAEESTHQGMKEIVFDDDYDLNGFNNQNLRVIQVVRIYHRNMSLLKRYKSIWRRKKLMRLLI